MHVVVVIFFPKLALYAFNRDKLTCYTGDTYCIYSMLCTYALTHIPQVICKMDITMYGYGYGMVMYGYGMVRYGYARVKHLCILHAGYVLQIYEK